MKIASFVEATEILNSFIPRPLNVRTVYSLDTIRALTKFLGNPQDAVRVVHIAGTSGKTSTAYYTAALLQAAGKKVGLTISPHITEINERVQLNLVPMAEAAFCAELGLFMDEVAKSGLKPTYFELMMAFAYWEFARQQVDYAVVEVGLGGLLDGSNIVSRADKVCVITDIGFDHMHVLGSTIAEITAQKAGIIHTGNDVFMHNQASEVMTVVAAKCSEVRAQLHVVDVDDETRVAALPLYQQRNMALAAATVQFALSRESRQLTDDIMRQAAHVHIPARMETFTVGNKTVVLDGAHNPQKLQAMADSLREKFPGQTVAALVGFTQSKEVSLRENLAIVRGVADRILVTSFGATQEHGQPSINPNDVAQAAQEAGVQNVVTELDYRQAVQALLRAPEPVLLVTGSLYLISYIHPLILAATSGA
ncbi:MAG TPA: Mur ligase family protein [Candidatus Saccharimonadales bacterium]|nr:Mur ligase family protein [Candidatus Saccharimonadales bacterium]